MTQEKPNILYLGSEPTPGMINRLQHAVNVHHIPDPSQNTHQLENIAASIKGLVTSASVGVSNDLLRQLPKLEIISSFGVGLDALDLDYLKAQGIHLGYTPNVLNDCVADLTLGLILDITRRISQSDRYVREGKWAAAAAPLRTQSSKKRLGLYGMGRIGQEIAQRASAFKMPIAYHTRTPNSSLPYLHLDSLEKLAGWSDILVVIVPATSSTRQSVNRHILKTLGENGYLINIARGSVINEADLLNALEQDIIAGAGLDVFHNEPNIDPRFYELENVVLSPHAGSATHETRQAMGDLTVNNLLNYFQSGSLIASYFES